MSRKRRRPVSPDSVIFTHEFSDSRVTREHREKLAKSANAVFVKCRAAVKEVQIKFMKKLELRAVNEKVSVEKMRLIQEQVGILLE